MPSGIVAFTGFTLQCPKAERALGFCAAIGVDAAAEDGAIIARLGPEASHRLRFEPAARKRLTRIAFSCRPEDVADFEAK